MNYAKPEAYICEVMALAKDLHIAGWKVKVAPFELIPILDVKAKINKLKRKTGTKGR